METRVRSTHHSNFNSLKSPNVENLVFLQSVMVIKACKLIKSRAHKVLKMQRSCIEWIT